MVAGWEPAVWDPGVRANKASRETLELGWLQQEERWVLGPRWPLHLRWPCIYRAVGLLFKSPQDGNEV